MKRQSTLNSTEETYDKLLVTVKRVKSMIEEKLARKVSSNYMISLS